MSEQDQGTMGKALAVQGGDHPPPAPRVRVQYTPVENAMGIMDTARFEHLGRVATVIARAGLLPQSLTHYKAEGARDTDPLVAHPFEVIQARAYMIVNQADLWHADPQAVAQCTSLVHGKLMYEGKLVHAIVSARLGVDLIYEFGRYDAAKRDIIGVLEHDENGERVWVGEMPGPDDQGLGVRVVGVLPGEKRPRTISGSVGMWHKGAKSPWGSATAWLRQLRYMGAREWTRAYKPSLLLGIITDDELDEYRAGLEVGNLAPSGPAPLHAGSEERRPAQLMAPSTDEAKERVRGKRAARRAAAEEPAAWAMPDAISGHAEPGEVYLHAEGSVLLEGGEKRMTFKDGVRFSAVGSEGAQPLFVYAEHAPELPACEECGMTEGHLADCPNAEGEEEGEPEDPTSEEADTGTDGAQDAESEPDTSAPATDASEDGAEASDSGLSPEAEGEGDEPPLPPEFAAYGETVDGATDFTTIKGALKAFMATATFKGFNEEQANGVRRSTWEAMKENFFPGDLPDPFADVSAFRLWVEAQDDAEALEAGLSRLEEHPDFKGKPDALKEALRGAVAARTTVLGEED